MAAAGAVGVLSVAAARRAARRLPAALAAAIGAIVATADAALFVAWAHAGVGYRSATMGAQVLTVVGLIAAVALVARWHPVVRTPAEG